jgi:hypothetical protein
MKTRKHCIVMAIAIIAFAVIGCKQDAMPTPIPESPNKTLPAITTGTGKSVTVTVNNYTSLSATAGSNLESALSIVLADTDAIGNLTINVVADGTDGFTKTNSKTLSVRASWINAAELSQVGTSLTTALPSWIAHATGVPITPHA